MPFDVAGARKAGYTDAEIADTLAKSSGFDVAGARGAKYSDSEIIAKLSAGAQPSAADQIPGMGPAPVARPAPTLGQRAVGAGEAALATISSPIAYLNGLAGGGNAFVKRLLAESLGGENPQQYDPGVAFDQASQAVQYTPRTEQGQEQAGAVADAMQGLAPLAGLTGELALMGQANKLGRNGATAPTTARATAEGVARDAGAVVSPAAGEAAAAGVSKAIDTAAKAPAFVRDAAAALPQRTRELIFGADEAAPTAGTMGSAGAAATDKATQRITTAESLGFTGDKALTTGQATRDFAQQQFEREQAKNGSTGAPLRDRFANQNAHLIAKLESEIDETGAQAPNTREAARTMDTALVQAAADSKRSFRRAYQAADQAGELREPVNLDTLVNHLNEAAPEATTAPLISTARNLVVKLGIAREEGGKLVPNRAGTPDTLMNTRAPNRTTLKTAETLRQAINRNIDLEPTNIRQGTIIKQLIDEATEGQGGDLYRTARKERQRHAQLFEDNAIVSDLLAKRRGTADRKVALEDVFQRTVLNGDRDSIGMLRRTFDVSDQRAGFKPGTEGPGAQAWREVQGSTLRHLLEKATENVGKDVAGNDIFSPAKLHREVTALDRDGRLDFILGKQRAQLVRDLNEVSRDVLTSPPGSVNTSNTSSAVLAAIAEAGITGTVTGLPLPVLSTLKAANQFVRDVKLRKRINAALTGTQRPAATP